VRATAASDHHETLHLFHVVIWTSRATDNFRNFGTGRLGCKYSDEGRT
jgi:hypothetical protein